MVEQLSEKGRYTDQYQMAEMIGVSRSKYDRLLTAFSTHGSEVRRDRVLERDGDIAPHSFVRKGNIEFVFPQQPTSISHDGSRVIDLSPAYGIWTEDITYSYNPNMVRGHLRVSYEDAGGGYKLSVTDLKGNSKLPDQIKEVIEQTFPSQIDTTPVSPTS